MGASSQDILKIANKICKREIYIGFSGESDTEITLSNLVDNFLQSLYKKQKKSISLISTFDEIFPSQSESIFSYYFSLVLLTSLTTLHDPKVDDYEDFLIKEIFVATSSLKDSTDSLLAFCQKCFSLIFKSNNQLFVRTLNILLTSSVNYSRLVLSQIDFPPFQSSEDVQNIALNLIENNSASPELTAKIFESFVSTDPSNIPKQIDTKEINLYKTLIQFLFSTIRNEENNEKFDNISKNKIHTEAIIQIAQKYFAVSHKEDLIASFVKYLKLLESIHHLNLNFTMELLENVKPANINQAYEVVRGLSVYLIHHLNSSSINNVIIYLKDITDYCTANIVVDDSSATSQFVNFINSENKEVHIYPYKKVERLCFYLLFNSNPEIRVNSYDLLLKCSQLFEKENSDWKEYEFSAQPLFRQLNSEFSSYVKKNVDFPMEARDFVYRSSLLESSLKYILRRLSNNRSEFCAKIIKEILQVGDLYPFMVMLLFTSMTPYLLRQKCSKKLQIQHKTFYNLAYSNPEALSMLDPSYLIEYLKFIEEGDIELFVQLTKSGLSNIKNMKKDQVQEEIDTFCKFERCSNVSLMSESLLNITATLEVIYLQNKDIDLTKLNSIIIEYLVSNSLISNLNPLLSESFLSYSNFLIKNGIDYKIGFIENCDIEFFETAFTKYPSKKEEIIFEALHFIPSVVTTYFLNQKSDAATSIKPEITGFLLTPNKTDELTELFTSKYPKIKNPTDPKNVISFLNDKQKNVLLYICLDFLKTSFVESIGKNVIDTIYLLKEVTPISQLGKDYINLLYIFFFKHPNISPSDLFFENEEQSFNFFKSFVELGASDVFIQELIEECPFAEKVAEKFLTDDWNFIENDGYEKVSDNSMRAFKTLAGYEKIGDKLENCQNIAAYRVYLNKLIKDKVDEEDLGIDFYASILTHNNQNLDYYKIVEFLITEITELIRNRPDDFDSPTLNTFFEVCVVVIYLGEEGIVHSVYNFIELVLNDESLKKKLFDQSFVSSVVKLSMIDDSFLSLITDNKMKVKISEYININDDKEVRFWYNAIYRKLDSISNEDLDFILSCVSMALEFNSTEMKQRCLMIISLLMPDKKSVKESDLNTIRDFLLFLILSKNVDGKFGHHILLFIDDSYGPFDLKLTDVDIQSYRNTPDDIRDYFKELLDD